MSAPKPDVLMPALCTDVLTIILEERRQDLDRYPRYLQDNYRSFHSLRLLSKQLNDLVLPISYREITLSRGIIQCFQTYLQLQHSMTLDPFQTPEIVRVQLKVVENIRTYSQHVRITYVKLHWPWVLGMLNSLKNLKHISWSCWGSSKGVNPSIQYAVLACPLFKARWPKLRISVADFYHEKAVRFYPLLKDIESCTHQVVMCGLTPSASVSQIKKLLLASPKMETLDLTYDKGDEVVADWDVKKGEKLPPFKNLNIYRMDWGFSLVEGVNFWDWSKITHLGMKEVPIIPFLKTVPPEYLMGLRTFKTDCWGSGDSKEEASKLLCNLVQKIASLEILEMKCSMEKTVDQCIQAIIKHGSSLHSLSLRDFDVPQDFPGWPSVLSIKKLTALRSACPTLTGLEIDIKLKLENLEKMGSILTTTLASFRNLRELKLHTWVSPETATDDYYYEILKVVAHPWIEDLKSSKSGVEFDSLSLYFHIVSLTALESYHRKLGVHVGTPSVM